MDSILVDLLGKLNVAVFESVEGRYFKLLYGWQDWLSDILPGLSLKDGTVCVPDSLTYLGNFVVDADAFWRSGSPGKLDSGVWSEVSRAGDDCLFTANAFNLEKRKILIIIRLGVGLTQAQLREQRVKDNLLAFEDLYRIEKDLEKYNYVLEAEVQKRTRSLEVRIKELNCLFDISRLIQEKGNDLEGLFRGVVEATPGGWQFPEITCARLTVDGVAYATGNWKETSWKQQGTVMVRGNPVGTLEVCYLEEQLAQDEGPFLQEEHNLVITVCELLGRAIRRTRAEQDLQSSYQVLNRTFEDTITAISGIVETRDPYTAGHQRRVAGLAAAIAVEMGMSDEAVHVINIAGTIHDIGKIYIPSEILSRPGKLGDMEFQMIKSHAQKGFDILKDIQFPWPIARIALQHHERLDGSGYPSGLKGDEIVLEARILAVADVVEAMTTHRPYRPALGPEKALAEISQKKGVAFDSAVVDACVKLFQEKGFTFPD